MFLYVFRRYLTFKNHHLPSVLGHKNVSTTQVYADMAYETKRQSVDRITLKPRITPQLKVVNN